MEFIDNAKEFYNTLTKTPLRMMVTLGFLVGCLFYMLYNFNTAITIFGIFFFCGWWANVEVRLKKLEDKKW